MLLIAYPFEGKETKFQFAYWVAEPEKWFEFYYMDSNENGVTYVILAVFLILIAVVIYVFCVKN